MTSRARLGKSEGVVEEARQLGWCDGLVEYAAPGDVARIIRRRVRQQQPTGRRLRPSAQTRRSAVIRPRPAISALIRPSTVSKDKTFPSNIAGQPTTSTYSPRWQPISFEGRSRDRHRRWNQ